MSGDVPFCSTALLPACAAVASSANEGPNDAASRLQDRGSRRHAARSGEYVLRAHSCDAGRKAMLIGTAVRNTEDTSRRCRVIAQERARCRTIIIVPKDS